MPVADVLKMASEMMRERGYSPEQAAENARRAHLEVPPFLYRKLVECSRQPAPEILDLGCGSVYPEAYSECEGLERVNLIDPHAEIREGECKVSIYVNPEVKQGLPAIAMHPGFSNPEYLYNTPPWSETLDRVKPSVICFSAYAFDEMGRELEYLGRNGYEYLAEGHNIECAVPLWAEIGAYYGNMWAIVTRC